MKKWIAVLVALMIALPLIASAHSGRTDSSGGHRDNKNKSGLGSYHYHHGMGAHLHPGGVCPYSAKPQATAKPTVRVTQRPTAKPTVRVTPKPTQKPTVRPTPTPTPEPIETAEPKPTFPELAPDGKPWEGYQTRKKWGPIVNSILASGGVLGFIASGVVVADKIKRR